MDDDLEHSLRRCHTKALLQQVTTAAASRQYLRASVPPVAVQATLLCRLVHSSRHTWAAKRRGARIAADVAP